MKLTTPKLLIILVVLVGIFAVVRLTGNKERSKSYRTELVTIDTAAISRIVVSGAEGDTRVSKMDGQWFVETEYGKKPAMVGTVKSMFTNLMNIEPSRLAARDESKWKDFSVDSTGTRVQLFEGEENVLDIVLGRFGVEGQRQFYTYVRLFEESDTYVAENFMKMSVDLDADGFRDNRIIRLEKDSLNTISFNYPDSSIVLSKIDNKWFKGSVEADSAETAQYISSLSFITSKEFRDNTDLITPDLNVTFGFTDRPEIQLSAYRRDGGWIIQSTENKGEAWSDQSQFDKIFVPTSKF
jgi:hypothetical protein